MTTYKETGSDEGEAGVLHAAIGEAGWQDEDVVDAPLVGAADALGRHQHVVHLAELRLSPWQHARLRPHQRSGADASGEEYGKDKSVIHIPIDHYQRFHNDVGSNRDGFLLLLRMPGLVAV